MNFFSNVSLFLSLPLYPYLYISLFLSLFLLLLSLLHLTQALPYYNECLMKIVLINWK